MKYQLLLDKPIKAGRLAFCRLGLKDDWYVLAFLGLLWLGGSLLNDREKGVKNTVHSWWAACVCCKERSWLVDPDGSGIDWQSRKLDIMKRTLFFSLFFVCHKGMMSLLHKAEVFSTFGRLTGCKLNVQSPHSKCRLLKYHLEIRIQPEAVRIRKRSHRNSRAVSVPFSYVLVLTKTLFVVE